MFVVLVYMYSYFHSSVQSCWKQRCRWLQEVDISLEFFHEASVTKQRLLAIVHPVINVVDSLTCGWV